MIKIDKNSWHYKLYASTYATAGIGNKGVPNITTPLRYSWRLVTAPFFWIFVLIIIMTVGIVGIIPVAIKEFTSRQIKFVSDDY